MASTSSVTEDFCTSQVWRDGAYLGKELINREFKIVALTELLDHLTDMVEKGRYTKYHNDLVHSCVETTVRKYFPKYFSAMSRTPCEHGKGKLYLGVDDDGYITGIPVIEKIDKAKIASIIQTIIETQNRGICEGEEIDAIKMKFAEHIEINVYDIGDDIESHAYMGSLEEFLVKADSEEKEYEDVLQKYINKLKSWRAHNAKYNVKLSTLSNDETLRAELLEYCIDKSANDDILSMLRSDDEIEIKIGVAERKYDDDNFDYWVTNFKEDMLKSISRPKMPQRPPHSGYEQMIAFLNNPLLMRKYWSGVQYQFIEIVLPMNIMEDCWIEYMDGDDWVSRVRMIKPAGDPCCRKI